jgi:hypothetical protein
MSSTESAFQFLVQKDYPNLFDLLKDNTICSELMQSAVFKDIFEKNFDELFESENSGISYIGILHSFHVSKNHSFKLSNFQEEKVLKFLINKTRKFDYAKLLPTYELSKEIINNHQQEITRKSEEDNKNFLRQKDFEIVETFSNNKSLVKSIFNSMQEKEFYLACKRVFHNQIILPNVSLTSIFNPKYIKEKYPQHFQYFLMASIDFAIVDEKTFIPYIFIELDSKTFHSSDKSLYNDGVKNFLFNELGKKLIRITKKNGKEGINEFIDLLNIIKKENED